MTWKIKEHTADVAIEAHGDDAGEALAQAATALASIVTGRDQHASRPEAEISFRIEAPDMPALAVAFLSELLWILESDGLLWLVGGATIEQTADGLAVTAAGNGLHYDRSIHGEGTEVKAVTYHDLVFEQVGPRWRFYVVLDI